MPRQKRCRCIKINPEVEVFKPAGVSRKFLTCVTIELDEIEAIRLKDLVGLNQEECAEKMKVSSSTFQRIINSAHQKVAQALVGGQSIIINKETMPNLDGTGPMGQGPRTGRGRGNCSNSPRNQASPGGNCLCPKCGEKTAHVTGQPCYQCDCPKCGAKMVREA